MKGPRVLIAQPPHDFDGDEIWPGLWIGGYPLEGEVPEEWAMVAVGWIRRSRYHKGPRIEYQMDDEEGAVPPRKDLNQIALWIHGMRALDRTVFVHCASGINRSALVLGYYACTCMGLTGAEVVVQLRNERNAHGTPMRALSNKSFADALLRWFPGGEG